MITKTVQVNSNYFFLMEAEVSGETWGLLYISTRLTFLFIQIYKAVVTAREDNGTCPFMAIYVGNFFHGICSVRHPSD